MIDISTLAKSLDATLAGATPENVTVSEATHDSRNVKPGSLFCCVVGLKADGHTFAANAIAGGASALLVERPLGTSVPEIVVSDVRRAMGTAAAIIHHHPSRDLQIIGVTGTNGKSSIVQLLADIGNGADRPTTILGTLTGARTTPEGTDLQSRLRSEAEQGTSIVAIEVSSHAMVLHRVVGTRFAVAVFTNLGRDHLDFHGDVESYFQAKASLFSPEFTNVAVINRDDHYGERLIKTLATEDGIRVLEYGLADAEGLETNGPVSTFTWRNQKIELGLAGHHNVLNALAAATAAEAIGLDPSEIAAGLNTTSPVRGRFEFVESDEPFQIAIDYAHTPDALAAVLKAAKGLTSGRVIAVFGCAGDRDREKRPEMGQVAAEHADVAIVSSDNPRSEDPLVIIDGVMNGVRAADAEHRAETLVEPDRRKAIRAALDIAKPGDLVIVAGKGHETTQTIGDTVLDFDDRVVVIEELGASA